MPSTHGVEMRFISEQVKFINVGGELRGANSRILKRAKVARRYAEDKSKTQPQEGEIWQCEVIYDTHPKDPRAGYLYLAPSQKVEEKAHWSVNGQGIYGVASYQAQVTYRKMFGSDVLEEKNYTVFSEADISFDCPPTSRSKSAAR